MVGEMRDLETISLAMEAAMTGHLVFGTLHTINAMKTVDRVIEIFPASQQGQVRSTLADALKAVVSQTLFKRVDVKGRCAALEILIATPAVRNLIREAKTYQILSSMQTGKKIRHADPGRRHYGISGEKDDQSGRRLLECGREIEISQIPPQPAIRFYRGLISPKGLVRVAIPPPCSSPPARFRSGRRRACRR